MTYFEFKPSYEKKCLLVEMYRLLYDKLKQNKDKRNSLFEMLLNEYESICLEEEFFIAQIFEDLKIVPEQKIYLNRQEFLQIKQEIEDYKLLKQSGELYMYC